MVNGITGLELAKVMHHTPFSSHESIVKNFAKSPPTLASYPDEAKDKTNKIPPPLLVQIG